jgi:DNA-binding NarL/FixJ family response regulator
MSDPVDALEQAIQSILEAASAAALIPQIYRIVDQWRQQYGGCEAYICKRSQARQHADVLRLASAGLPAGQIAKVVGVSVRQVRRIRSRRSDYLR